MALTKLNIKIEIREILLKERPSQLFAISSKGTVPVLQLPHGRVIDESIDILHWVYNHPDVSELVTDHSELVQLIDTDFKHWLDRYKYPERYPDHSQNYYGEQAVEVLNTFENVLGKSTFFGGQTPGFLDITIFPLVRQFAHVNLEMYQNSFTSLYDFYLAMHSHSCFTSVMEKYPQWHQGDPPLLVNFYVPENTEKLIQRTP